MKTNHPKFKWLTDALLFLGFLIACWLELTGVELHQWLGLAVSTVAMYHLIAHWAWVKGVAARFFGGTSAQARGFMLIDALVFVGLSIIVLTGLVISTWFNLSAGNDAAWFTLHVSASLATLGLLILKIGMHRRWIVDVSKRYLVPQTAPRVQTLAPRNVTNAPTRREMLKLMGIIGAASMLPMLNAFDALTQDNATVNASNSVTQNNIVPASSITTNTMLSGTTNACTVRCNKGCSYPGRCRRYVDSNNNGRCDLGECV